ALEPLHQLSVGGNAEVGTAIAGDMHGDINIGQQTFEAAVQVFFGERKDTNDQDRAMLASYLSNMIARFSLADQPDTASKDQQYSPIAPESLRRIYLTM